MRVSDVGFWVHGKAAVVSLLVTSGGLEKRMKAEVGSMAWRLDGGLSTLAVSGTLDVGLAAVNKHFNEQMNSPAERSKSGGGGFCFLNFR